MSRARTARQALAARVPESAFTQQVIALARMYGWRSAHFRPAQNARGNWRTPVAGDGAGFPDLVLLRGARVIVAELKAEGRYPRPDQRAWLDAWRAAGAEVNVWRPSDLDAIARVLR